MRRLVMAAMAALLPLPLVPLPLLGASAPPSPEAQAAAAQITPALLRAHVGFLADDLLEGRGIGTKGGAVAARYVASVLESLGLEPAGDGGTFFQRIPLSGVRTNAPGVTYATNGAKGLELRRNDDLVLVALAPEVSLKDAPLVFAGYGIVAPEAGWDDYKGFDAKGKVLVLLNGDPDDDPAHFGGAARVWAGRWEAKCEEAARRGAAGVLVIHSPVSAGFPWAVVAASFAGERFDLRDGGKGPRLLLRGWASESAGARMAALAGEDLGRLAAAARRRDFRPVPLGTWSAALTTTRREVTGTNVLARLPGGEPKLAREAVLFTAHLDQLGRREAKPGIDLLFNGAVDGATGVAALLGVARAMAALPARPARTLLFAATGAEDQTHPGARWLAEHLPVPAGRIAADVNFDALAPWGETRDAALCGLGRSDLDDVVRPLAEWQGRTLTAEPDPARGHFFRSDDWVFARLGVPALYLRSGVDVAGKPPGWGRGQLETWVERDYRRPSDEVGPAWDLRGMAQDARLAFLAALAVANAPEMPRWRPGDELEAVRKEAISEAR